MSSDADAKYDVFISYSRLDSEIVDRLEKLLGLSGRRVFRDTHSIKPGDMWQETLSTALSASKHVVVFWCCHAGESPWVEHELGQAVAEEKSIVPVLLCRQQMPPTLADYQWIDLILSVRHECGHASKEELPTNVNAADELREIRPKVPTNSPGPKKLRVRKSLARAAWMCLGAVASIFASHRHATEPEYRPQRQMQQQTTSLPDPLQIILRAIEANEKTL